MRGGGLGGSGILLVYVCWDGWMFKVPDEMHPLESPHGDNKN